MTIEITEFRCPTCGHLMGQEEYERAIERMNKIIDETSTGQIEKIKDECDQKILEAEHKTDNRILELKEQHKLEIKDKANQIALLKIKEVQSRNDEEKVEMENKHRKELVCKDKQIEEAKLQRSLSIDEKIRQAVEDREEKYRQKVMEYEIQLNRIEKDNQKLVTQVEHLQKTLDNVPPELRGTAGEIVLLDDLHTAFPNDRLDPKIVGVEMPDVVQTVVTDNGEKIAPTIVWDIKTGEKISKADIEKAHIYKTKYQTDFSIIVTAKGITSKDSNNSLIGRREDIMLVHPKIAIEVARLLRSFLIENARQAGSKNGRESKQRKLFDYIMSPKYAMKMKTIVRINSNLERLQSNEENHHKTTWRERKKLIENWFKVDECNQHIIDEIIQDQTNEQVEDHLVDEEEN